ncbi:hypothetical protein PCANC_01032 [Puccinia coronata f. sp. avenae]|uniref:Uncharacterized protein n=1 Tax=Puccinia coronata f. sp. avenae TaxID=200324 RepID=A0A2N5W6J7_9BASI|nr:hypothetical protein PCANC_01032 [Puccinia coronata f. sp. avenae]
MSKAPHGVSQPKLVNSWQSTRYPTTSDLNPGNKAILCQALEETGKNRHLYAHTTSQDLVPS